MKYLNLGCGRRFHHAWTNVDFVQSAEEVIACDLRQGVPFPDESFDVVYHSHLLEHIPKAEAEFFLSECHRLLSPHGIVRVAVPDLEQIAGMYLKALDQAAAGSQEWIANYEWMLLEMYDQAVRNRTGGEMADYLLSDRIPNEEFVMRRVGSEAGNLISKGRKLRRKDESEREPEPEVSLRHALRSIYRLFRYSDCRREALLKKLLGDESRALQIGRFRLAGENHQWMYDRYSLAVLLKRCGFSRVVQRSAVESYVSGWASWNLDTEPDGTVYKPDSLYMEGVKV